MKTPTMRDILASAFVLSCVTYAAADTGWTAYRGAHTTGQTTEKVGKSLRTQVWKTPLTNGFSSFSLADGKAYTLVSREIEGNALEVLVALDATTGQELWAYPMKFAKYDGGGNDGEGSNKGGDGPRSTPAVAQGKVYVLGANLDLHAIDATTGQKAWSHDLVSEYGARNIRWGNAASPVVYQGHVYVAGGGEGQALLAFKADSGQLAWKAESDQITHATPVVATIHGVPQIVFYTQSGLVAVTPDQGKILWRHPYRYNVSSAASPVIWEDMIYCGAGYSVGSTGVQITKEGDAFKATEKWRLEGDDVTNHWSTPVAKDGYLYGMFSFKKYGKGPLLCVDIKTGEVKWSKDGFGAGNIILADDTLVALSDRGEVVTITADPSAYKEKARHDVLDGKCWSTPALSQSRLYVRSTKEGVALDVSK
jgi:outer membrane protein assembly factor BamB